MRKKGQVTIFIISGILILILIIAIIYIASLTKESEAELTTKESFDVDSEDVRKFIDLCIQKTSYDGLKKLGKKGGYTKGDDDIPPLIQYSGTSYWYYDQGSIQPTLNQTGIRLERYIDSHLANCINNFEDFKEMGYEVDFENPKSTVFYTIDSVNIRVNCPVNIKRLDFVKDYDKFEVNLNVRFREIFETATAVNHWQMHKNFMINEPLGGINELPNFNNDFSISSDKTALGGITNIRYTITDAKRQEQGENFIFEFASRFDDSNLIRKLSLPESCNGNPTTFPIVLYSMDRKAQLILPPGTTMVDKNGNNVCEISIQQIYLDKLDRDNVPNNVFTKIKKGGFSMRDDPKITLEWPIETPFYKLMPDGLVFTDGAPKRFMICQDESVPIWDASSDDEKPYMIFEHDGLSRPVNIGYDGNCIYTDIPSFTGAGAGACDGLQQKSFTTKVEAGGNRKKCLIKLAIIVGAIIVFGGYGLFKFGPNAIVAWGSATTIKYTLFTAFLKFNYLGYAILAAGTIAGGYFFLPEEQYEAQPTMVPFTPACPQAIYIDKDAQKSKGKCLLNGEDVGSNVIINEEDVGKPYQLQAALKKCKGKLCPKCSLTCSTMVLV